MTHTQITKKKQPLETVGHICWATISMVYHIILSHHQQNNQTQMEFCVLWIAVITVEWNLSTAMWTEHALFIEMFLQFKLQPLSTWCRHSFIYCLLCDIALSCSLLIKDIRSFCSIWLALVFLLLFTVSHPIQLNMLKCKQLTCFVSGKKLH